MSSWSALDGVPDAIRSRAARIRLACFDVDGVMTDGGLFYSDSGHEAKQFHAHDGLGLKLLIDSGVVVAVITARDTPAVSNRMRDLGIERVFLGERNKRARVQRLMDELGIGRDEVAFCGDDLPDLSAMEHVGFAITVPNAHALIKPLAHWQTTRAGGHGAVREVCDLIISARGGMDVVLGRFRA